MAIMKIRNNCKKHMEEWMGYMCPGGEKVDMHPDSVFECSDEAGAYLLRTLGAPGWLVLAGESVVVPEVVVVKDEVVVVVEKVVEEPKAEEKVEVVAEVVAEEVAPEEVAPEAAPAEEVVEEAWCDECPSKGGRHKLLCPKRRE